MIATVTGLISASQSAMASLSERSRFGLIALLSLMGVYLIVNLDEANTRSGRSLDNLQRQLSARQAALEQRDWAALAAEAERLTGMTEARFWQAPTEGIAAARLQGALEAAAREAGLRDARVRLATAGSIERHAAGPETLLFEAEVSARDSGGSFAPFIEAATGAAGELRAIRLDWDARTQRFTLTFIAPALLEPGS